MGRGVGAGYCGGGLEMGEFEGENGDCVVWALGVCDSVVGRILIGGGISWSFSSNTSRCGVIVVVSLV